MAGTGFETTANSSEKTSLFGKCDVKSDVIHNDAVKTPSDLALALLARAWPSLSLADQKAILDIVRR